MTACHNIIVILGPRLSLRQRVKALLGLVLALAMVLPAYGQTPEGDAVVSAYQTLVGPGQTLADRTAAARVLLLTGSKDAEQALNSALASGQDANAWRAVLLAVASGVSDPPEEVALPVLSLMMRIDADLVPEWADAMGRFSASDKWRRELDRIAADTTKGELERVRAIAALGRFREKVVAERLIALTDVGQAAAVQQAAFESLATLTGIEAFTSDRNMWNQWYAQSRRLSDARWHRHLVENFTRRAAAGNTKRQELEDRLLESQRALYRTTSPDDRSAVLAYMLADPLIPIRLLGMDLVQQRLVGGEAFDEPLRKALRARLEDESPVIRQRAALRLRDLGDTAAADLIATRLADGSEQVAAVLRADLLMMTAVPRAVAADAALALLSRPELRADAAGALASMHRTDQLTRRQADRARQQLRRALSEVDTPAPPEIALLAAIGDDDDWNRIAGWVDHREAPIREAAARAWAGSDRSLKILAERAADPVIQPIVIAAAIRRGDDPWTLLALTPNRPEQDQAAAQWERALAAVAGRIDSGSVLKAADILINRNESVELLDAVYSANIDAFATAQQPPEGWVDVVLRRAALRMQMGNAALAAADYERLIPRNDALSRSQKDTRDRGLIEAYLLTGEDQNAIKTLLALLGNGNGGLRPNATDDPMVGSVIDAVDRHVKADRIDQAGALLDRLRDILGPSVSPVIANRMAPLRAQIERDKLAGRPGGS